jgi:hypothetical protein
MFLEGVLVNGSTRESHMTFSSFVLNALVMSASVYILARIINMSENSRKEKEEKMLEQSRLNKVAALYGREK